MLYDRYKEHGAEPYEAALEHILNESDPSSQKHEHNFLKHTICAFSDVDAHCY
jgi:hypothetical protein